MPFVYVTAAVRAAALTVAAVLAWAQLPAQPQTRRQDPAVLFARAAAALQANDLRTAESGFRAVIRIDPRSAAALTNLGVTLMREKRWPDALNVLSQAEHLEPAMDGIPLDLGLVRFHTADYAAAVPEFRRALTQAPDNSQARFLLGLSCFFTTDYTCAADTLGPLWPGQSANLTYLYVLGSAARQAGQPDLADRAFRQMATVGQDTPEFHLFAGKAALGKQDYTAAQTELELAIARQPTLPMVHFFLAEAFDAQHNEPAARAELLSEIRLEPDIPFPYDELGRVSVLLGDTAAAETAYRSAIARDSTLASSYLGLATLLKQESRPAEALALLDHAVQLSPTSGSLHYLRAQLLHQLHRDPEARMEFTRSASLLHQFNDNLQHGSESLHDADTAQIRTAAQL